MRNRCLRPVVSARTIMLALSLALLNSSCAYFNTFHNTKSLYNNAKKEREKRKDNKITPAERKLYDETITKASKILELYPNSKYVDDALFILGESFYHKGESIKAQRKFQELITYFPSSDYFLRAKVWLAKTNVKLRDYAAARVILNELLAQSELDKEAAEEAHFNLGEIQFSQGFYEEAAKAYHAAAQIGKNRSTTSNAWLHLGECQLFFGNNSAAVTSFRNAVKTSPDNLQGFDARLNYINSLKLSGDFKTAARLCNELLDNPVFQRKSGFLRLELADIIYWEGKALNDRLKGTDLKYLGKIDEAIEKYEIVILQNKRSEVSATAHYRIADIREHDLRDFAGAKEHYEKVKLEYSRSEYAEQAQEKAKNIAELIRLNNLINEDQGGGGPSQGGGSGQITELEMLLLEHGVHPEVRFMQEQRRVRELADAVDAPEANVGGLSSQDVLQLGKLNELVANKLQLAEIYLFQFSQVDSALKEYSDVLGLFPDHPDGAKALYSSAYIYENVRHNKFKTDSLLYELIEQFPESRQAQDAHRKMGLEVTTSDDPAAELFRRAEYSMVVDNDVSGAIRQYQRVISTYPESAFAPKALFAMGWLYENRRFDNAAASKFYLELKKNYPETEFFNAVNQKLMALEASQAKQTPAPQDSASTANPAVNDEPEEPDLRQRREEPQAEDPDEVHRRPNKATVPGEPDESPPVKKKERDD